MRRILQINDENGTTHTDQGEVAQEFVSYYQNLLGGTRQRLTVDIRYLRPWARHCITDEEASHLLLPFSPDDVKQAVFDIAEDKAPGPDGYSSGFFKAAWPMEGEEVTRAILDFFLIEKLLKQVNSTILALITKRLSVLLEKIISPCQTAFIPGRSIGDNIMLAQKLFSGYNQMRLPPRCALKVDIRKAYDTMERDFLLAVFQLFRFPPKFTRWIEECVSTTSFSIGLNGIPHGFFTGEKGLRQGDRLSPYMFVLVMEALHMGFLQRIEQDMQFTYHWKCESSKVFQLGFAEDLLLFCRADFDSIRVFKEGLDWIENPDDGDFGLSREATTNEGGSWGWRKMLRLHPYLRSIVDYQIGNGGRFFIWQDPLHHLGPLIERFPRGPRHLRLEESAKLNSI
ncbi:uncharacterized protein LOC105180023 [Sesamum indicum]|uniref:Uncharacterized protein LOC105180023 n=1 Tax=Sesamum indicum TaxID=4182 RepID=A0A6I9UN21_SESIN|nr:uncharacterized protein LOC105180023 [Sesamum indicum]